MGYLASALPTNTAPNNVAKPEKQHSAVSYLTSSAINSQ